LKCAGDKAILNSLEGVGLQRKLCTELDEGVSELMLIVCKNSTWKQIVIELSSQSLSIFQEIFG